MPVLGHDTLKTVIRGTIGGIQSWSTAFWMDCGIGTVPTQAQLDTWAASELGPLTAWWGPIAAHCGPGTKWVDYDVYYYGAGSLTSSLLSHQALAAALPGTSGSDGPSFIAQVASLRSATPGRSGRGRMYIPMTAVSSLNGDYSTNAAASDYVNTTATLLSAVQALPIPFSAASSLPVVASFTRGHTYPIVSVEGGNRYEVQRRRNDKFIDTIQYTAAV